MIINGILEAYFEIGIESIIWSVYENGASGYDGLHILKNGDKISIAKDEKIINLIVDLDYNNGACSDGNRHQSVACNMWCHGIQRGWDADEWGEMFLKGLPCTLERVDD